MDIFGTDNQVQGNYIGTDVTGTAAIGNGEGIFITGSNNRIGGTAAGAGNVISGNFNGVYISGGGGTLVQGNRIGTDASGTAPLGNVVGVLVVGPDTTVGGTAAGAGNIISGNGLYGAFIAFGGTTVQGNFIGTDATGAPGGQRRRRRVSRFARQFGRWNGGRRRQHHRLQRRDGCRAAERRRRRQRDPRQQHPLERRPRHRLGGDGVTPNDPGDADSGPNRLQNFPVLGVALAGATTRVSGTLNSSANTSFTVDFYASAAADPSGFGEGAALLGRPRSPPTRPAMPASRSPGSDEPR